jgi:hypothetical protein
VLDLRLDHGAQRLVLQVRELRHDVRLRVISSSGWRLAPRDSRGADALSNLVASAFRRKEMQTKGRRQPALCLFRP